MSTAGGLLSVASTRACTNDLFFSPPSASSSSSSSSLARAAALRCQPFLCSKHPLMSKCGFRVLPACRAAGKGDGKQGEAEATTDREEEKKGVIRSVEGALGRSFGKPLWFAVLMLSFAFFVAAYFYLFSAFGDPSDIPIFNGPASSRL